MKPAILSFILFISAQSYSQDSLQAKKIDSLVSRINDSGLPVIHDSIINNFPDLGLYMRTDLTMVVEGHQLKKYVNYVNSTQIEKGVAKNMITSNNFYFDQHQLIKVEEIAIEKNKVLVNFSWYYTGDRYFYFQPVSDKMEARAKQLLSLSKTLLKQVIKE